MHSSFTYDSQQLERAQVAINREVDIQTSVYSYSSILLMLQNRPGGGGVNDILLPKGPALLLWGFPHLLGLPCLLPGRDVSQGQRLVKRKGILYLKVIHT